jgi:hypothetical protein
MSKSTPNVPPQRKPRWRRIARIAGIIVLAIIGIPAGLHFYLRWTADRALQQAIAETDRLDPGWRLEDLEAKREIIPEAENAALKILAIKESMPSSWPNQPRFIPIRSRSAINSEPGISELEQRLLGLSPPAALPAEIRSVIQSDLKAMAASLADALALVRFPRGRYPIQYARILSDTELLSKDSHIVAKLLWVDGIIAAEEQQIERAFDSTRGIINAGRSVGDEPMMISQSRRLTIESLAIQTLERALAHGQAPAEALQGVQQLLEEEAAEPLLLRAFRGERAASQYHLAGAESGKLRFRMRFYRGPWADDMPKRWRDYLEMVIVRRAHSGYLKLLTELVETAKLPAEQWPARLREIDERGRQLPIEFQSWLQSSVQSAEPFQKNQALLRCAIAGVAVERYRLARGRWPDSLATVVPDFLEQMPLDPYDGQPLRLRRLEDGVVIYSLGPDAQNDGGKLDRQNPSAPGTDLGFQLWDVNHRKQNQ